VDASGQSLLAKLRAFFHFIAVRCTDEERRDYLNALESISTRATWTVDDADDEETTGGLFAPVRLAAGGVKSKDRQQLMLGFNTPFFPEILVASSVLAEGVDLHLNCRYVIHHDLCWNPSTLEQRTGRIDRIGAKAEQALQSIHTFEPFVTATQDEKMYRVVKDRERWFQVLLSERFVPDEAVTDGLEERVALPEEAAGGLALRLGLG